MKNLFCAGWFYDDQVSAYRLKNSMNRHLLHRVIAVICMLATGFQTVAGGLLVHCKEANGTSHLEWGGCGRDEMGRCAKPCSPEHSDDPESSTTNPCQDEPVKSSLGASPVRAAAWTITAELPQPELAAVFFPADRPSQGLSVRCAGTRATAAPPDIACIRSIVMLV